MDEDQLQACGDEIARILKLRRKHGRFVTSSGDKTSIGLVRTIMGCLDQHYVAAGVVRYSRDTTRGTQENG